MMATTRNPDTAMRQAFEKAGVSDPEERLKRLALKAMVEHADSNEDTIEAIWQGVQKERALLVELFKLDYHRAISGLLYRVRGEVAFAARQDIKKSKLRRQAERVVDIHEARQQASAAEILREQEAKQAIADQEYRDYLARWKRTQIGHLEVHGTPIWEVTAGTARAWLVQQRRPLRTVELLIEGLPDDGRPIGYYRRPEDVEELWKRASAE